MHDVLQLPFDPGLFGGRTSHRGAARLAPLLPSPARSCDDGQTLAGIYPSPSLPSLLMAFNYPFLPPTQLLMTSHLQPQGLEVSCRHHLPKQPKASPCRDVPSASSIPQHPAATRAAGPHAGALGRPQHVAGKDLTSAAGESFPPPPKPAHLLGPQVPSASQGHLAGEMCVEQIPREYSRDWQRGDRVLGGCLARSPPPPTFCPALLSPNSKSFLVPGLLPGRAQQGPSQGRGRSPGTGTRQERACCRSGATSLR